MRPGPPLYAPPPPPVDSLPAGYAVALCGDPDRVLQQQRLLPLSRNILCLPPLKFPAPAPTSRRAFALNPRGNPNSEAGKQDLFNALKASVLQLHRDYIKRHQAARDFLSSARTILDCDRRVVFYNGGERDAKVLCLEGLRDALGDEATVEALWRDIVRGGVEGLVERELDGSDTPNVQGVIPNLNIAAPNGFISQISPTDSDTPVEFAKGSFSFARNRANTVTQMEVTEEEEPDPRQHRLDSTYSSGMDSIPTPPASAEIRDAEFLYQSKLSDRGSPTPSSHEHSDFAARPVEALFSTFESPTLEVHLVPEKYDTRQQLLDRLLPLPSFGTSRITAQNAFRTPLRRMTSSLRQVFSIDIPADKSPLEVQNELRVLLQKYLPPANTAETPTQAEFPEASAWLMDQEVDLFAPLLSLGDESIPCTLCPALDLIVAVGADGAGREVPASDTTRKTTSLAGSLCTALESLGNQADGDTNAYTRGARITVKTLLRDALHYLPSHPGTTLDDIAAGCFLLPALEAHLKSTPSLRLLILEFDLRTGSQAIVALKTLVPTTMLRLLIIGEQPPPIHNHGGRIYVRQSIGKTTMSFSSLPSPVTRERPKHRPFQAARTAALSRADLIISPSAGEQKHAAALEIVREGIRARRIECGVLAVSATEPTVTLSPPLPSSSPPAVCGRATPPPEIRLPQPRRESARKMTRSPSPGARMSGEGGEGGQASFRSSIRSSTSTGSGGHMEIHPGMMHMPMGRRDSDTNSHGGGVKITTPTPSVRSRDSTLMPHGGSWGGGSFLDEGEEGTESEDEEVEERERMRMLKERKGSKALRWLGIIDAP